MDHPTLLLRDSAVRVANRAESERLRKAKEDKKRKKLRKLRAWERGEDTDGDDDDDDGDDDEVMEVADDIEWDNLENAKLNCMHEPSEKVLKMDLSNHVI